MTIATQQAYAVQYLVNAGLTPLGASALVARWGYVESSSIGALNLDASNTIGGGHWGLSQWGLARGGADVPGMTLDQQLGKVVGELNTTERAALAQLNNASNADEAAIGASMFERAGGYNKNTGIDNFTGTTAANIPTVLKNYGGDNYTPEAAAAGIAPLDSALPSSEVTPGNEPVGYGADSFIAPAGNVAGTGLTGAGVVNTPVFTPFDQNAGVMANNFVNPYDPTNPAYVMSAASDPRPDAANIYSGTFSTSDPRPDAANVYGDTTAPAAFAPPTPAIDPRPDAANIYGDSTTWAPNDAPPSGAVSPEAAAANPDTKFKAGATSGATNTQASPTVQKAIDQFTKFFGLDTTATTKAISSSLDGVAKTSAADTSATNKTITAATGSVTGTATNLVDKTLATGKNLFVRFAVISLGLIFVGGGLAMLAGADKIVMQTAKSAAKGAIL